jgi:hypothetical protein
VEPEITLSRREATLRSAATASLAGIALVQALGLPSLFVQGGQLVGLAIAATAACLGLGLSLAAASADATRQVWRVVAAAAVLVIAGWAVPHALAVPGLVGDTGHWTAPAGLACAALAAVCLALAVAAVRPGRAAIRTIATTLVVVVALAPAAAVLLVGLGPGTTGGETVLASGGHLHSLHSHGSPESAIVFQPLPGGHGGRYVYKTTPIPHHTPVGIALMVAAAFVFTYGAVAYLRRRSTTVAPAESLGLAGIDLERGLA